MSKKRFAFVGTGGRALSFIEPLATTWREGNELVALCDPSAARMAYYNGLLAGELGYRAVPALSGGAFCRDDPRAETRHGFRLLRRCDPPRLHRARAARRMRCHHREADDDGRREMPRHPPGRRRHRPLGARGLQLPLGALPHESEGAAHGRRDRSRPFRHAGIHARYEPRRRLFPSLARRGGQLGHIARPQEHAPLRPRELVARRDPRAGLRVR